MYQTFYLITLTRGLTHIAYFYIVLKINNRCQDNHFSLILNILIDSIYKMYVQQLLLFESVIKYFLSTELSWSQKVKSHHQRHQQSHYNQHQISVTGSVIRVTSRASETPIEPLIINLVSSHKKSLELPLEKLVKPLKSILNKFHWQSHHSYQQSYQSHQLSYQSHKIL